MGKRNARPRVSATNSTTAFVNLFRTDTMEFIDLKSQYRALKTDIDARIQAVLNHGQYIMGPEVAELEARLATLTGAKHCVSVASGTEALLRADAPHPLAHFLAADYSPWASHAATGNPGEQALTEQMHACLESLTDRVGQGLINEADYFAAANRAMFYTNHGHAYRAALTHIDRAQGARSAA